MLRIYFTTDDVARTRLAPGPDPLWELVMSVHMLRRQPGDLLFAQWRQAAGPAIRRAALGDRLRLLLALTPTAGYFPDFLNPSAAAQGLQHGLEAIRETPKSALAHDMRQLARSRALPDGVQHLASGQPAMLAELTDTMQTCYDLTVAPYRRTVETAVERDRQYRARALADGGVEGLLASFRPTMQWDAGELRIPSHRDQELHLCGRGLLFIPLCWKRFAASRRPRRTLPGGSASQRPQPVSTRLCCVAPGWSRATATATGWCTTPPYWA